MILTITPNTMLVKMMKIPHFEHGAQVRPSQLLTVGGGKGIHVARVVRQLGADSLAVGYVGGHIGAAVQQSLSDEGLPFDPVQVAGETRIGFCLLNSDLEPIIEVPEPGPELSSQDAASLMERVQTHLVWASLVVCSGSLPKGVDPDFYKRVVEAARGAGKRCLVDTHGLPLRRALRARPYAIKPNWDELREFAGHSPPSALEDLAAFVHELFFESDFGAEHVVVSMGGRGVLLVTEDSAWHIGYDGKVTGNPIGSGDTLVAGMAVGLTKGEPMVQAVQLGVACATANLKYLWPGYCTPDDVEEYLPLVRIRAIVKGR